MKSTLNKPTPAYRLTKRTKWYPRGIKTTMVALALLFVFAKSYAQQDEEFHLDETYEINSDGKLWMNPEDAQVQIIGSNRSDVRVKIDRIAEIKTISRKNAAFKIDVSSREGDVFIKETEPQGSYFIKYGRIDYKILVELPEGASLVVKSDDSNYEVKNVNGAIDITLDDGDATLTDCNGSSFDFNLDDGDVLMDRGSGELYAQLDDGDIKITNAAFDKVNVSGDDGSIFLSTQLAADGSYELAGDDAEISLEVLSGGGNFFITGDDTRVKATAGFDEVESSESRHRYRLPGGQAKVRIRNDDGSVRISSPGS